ncbi:MAG: Holliday junction resolvase RuvX [Gemmata sp.]
MKQEGEKGSRGKRVPESGAPAPDAAPDPGPVAASVPLCPSPLHPLSSKGPLIGVDFGTKRIGVAVCDPDRIVASPVGTVANDVGADTYFRDLLATGKFIGIVVGLPLHASGAESPMSAAARSFAARLAALGAVPAVMWDERLSSFAAEGALREAGYKRKKVKEKVDRVAAQMILQSYLDAGCPPHGSAPPQIDPVAADDGSPDTGRG